MSDTFDHEQEAFERWENGERDAQYFENGGQSIPVDDDPNNMIIEKEDFTCFDDDYDEN